MEGLKKPLSKFKVALAASAYIEHKEDVTWYLKTLQVALALAIIRSKPPDKSSKEYAEHLANIVSGQNSKWKMRVEMLEAEVLRLRQQLFLRKVSSGFSIQNRTSVVLDETLVPSNTEDCSGHFEDSGCDTSSDYIADTLRTWSSLDYKEHGCISSVTSSSTFPKLTPANAQSRKSLLLHMQFLQYFIELRNLTEPGGLRTDLKMLGKDCSIILDSFFRLMDGLVTSYSLPELPFSNVVTQAVCVITKILSDADLFSLILGKCFKKLEDFVKRLVAIILNSNSLNRMQSKYNIRYENIFFLCKVLEQLLETGTEQEKAASPVCDVEEKKKILQSLSQAVFHLSDEFPLFCIYLWRLGTLLNAAQIEAVQKASPAL